jgi:hypothetical protein
MTERICYIHAGTGKTGSSAIQYTLTKAADDLRARGYLYPDFDRSFDRVLDFKPTAGNARVINRQVHSGEVDRALDWISPHADDPSHLILSNEGFVNAGKEHLTKFSEGLRDLGYTTRCLVFFRLQYDLVVSSYLQQVKSDKLEHSQTLREYALSRYSHTRNPFNWLERVKRLERAFSNVTVRWYPAVARQGPNGVVDAAFQWLGVPSLASASGARIINPTPGLEALHVLQRINAQGLGSKPVADAILIQAQAEGVLGSKVVLDDETTRLIHSAMYDSNVALLERYCPDLSPAEELKLPDTSAEQSSFDPEIVNRLDAIAAEVLAQSKDGSLDPRRRQRARRDLKARAGAPRRNGARTRRWWRRSAVGRAPAGD